ncbi:hypothetical protein KR018_008019 [Drosophila ironensis]|nr:hypothetical protein KR018_008019 [Drosophila ironensis]
MLRVLRQISVAKVNAQVLRGITKYSQCMGVIFFRLKENKICTKTNWLKCLSVIHRLMNLCVFASTYAPYIVNDRVSITKLLHGIRFLVGVFSSLWIIKLQIFNDMDIIKFVQRFIELFGNVKSACIRRRIGFGGKKECCLILLNVCGMIHEIVYRLPMIRKFVLTYGTFAYLWCNTYIIVGTNMFLHINLLAYISFGIMFAELNYYFNTELMPQLYQLQASSDRKKLRRKLKKCLDLYGEIFRLKTSFDELFLIPLFFAIIYKTSVSCLVAYSLVIHLKFRSIWLSIMIVKHILDLLLLTSSIQNAMAEFSMIRWINFEASHEDFQDLLDSFSAFLSLQQFRARILGLFDVSNKFFILYVYGLLCWLVFIMQYAEHLGNTGKYGF